MRFLFIRIIIILYALLFHWQPIKAQTFGNEWINYNQNYYKFPVLSNGIYRIAYTTLQNAGIPVSGINPKNIQIFGRGKEVPLYIEGEGDGVFNSSDYIEFYAERNDGWFDSLAYDTPQHVGNPYYSLFNDTAYYFLTWNNSVLNERYTLENDTVNFSSFTAEPFCLAQSLHYLIDSYYPGETNAIATTDPEYTKAEGWFSDKWQIGGGRTENLLKKMFIHRGHRQPSEQKLLVLPMLLITKMITELRLNSLEVTRCNWQILFLMVIR